MKNILSKIALFAAGAAIGSAVTWKILDVKYRRIAQEEIDSYKEYCADKMGLAEFEQTDEEGSEATYVRSAKPDIREYAAKLNDMGYTKYANNANEENKEADDTDRPYIIEPEEYGECDYDLVELTYYANGVLTDDMDNVIDDVDDIVGLDSLEQIGKYEEDALHVRNDRLKCDYEILRDYSEYSPHQSEDE